VRKSSEEVIQQVLAGLRDCEASAGMERRILEAVRHRASARSAAGWGSLRPLAHWCAMWPFAGGLALVVLFVSLPVFVVHRTRVHVHATRVASLPAAAPAKVAEEDRTKPRAPIARSRGSTITRKKVGTRASDLAILRDIRAPSHPAPEAPLTEEEKILLRVAQTGDAEEFAMLNPEMRARQDAQMEADFERFVAQSSKPDQE
jgi:hypothetical protein